MRARARVVLAGWIPGIPTWTMVLEGEVVARSACRDQRDAESGFVATEFAFGVAVLVLPVALLVLTFPRWSERQVTARVIGREVARRAARDGDVRSRAAARALGTTMARNLGVAPADVSVDLAMRRRRRARAG